MTGREATDLVVFQLLFRLDKNMYEKRCQGVCLCEIAVREDDVRVRTDLVPSAPRRLCPSGLLLRIRQDQTLVLCKMEEMSALAPAEAPPESADGRQD